MIHTISDGFLSEMLSAVKEDAIQELEITGKTQLTESYIKDFVPSSIQERCIGVLKETEKEWRQHK